MSTSIRNGVLLLVVFTLSGCVSRYRIWTNLGPTEKNRVPEDSPFRITRSPAKDGLDYRGQIAFYTNALGLRKCLNALRDRARRMGGNLVAELRCQSTFQVPSGKAWRITRNRGLFQEADIHCFGNVYYDHSATLAIRPGSSSDR